MSPRADDGLEVLLRRVRAVDVREHVESGGLLHRGALLVPGVQRGAREHVHLRVRCGLERDSTEGFVRVL